MPLTLPPPGAQTQGPLMKDPRLEDTRFKPQETESSAPQRSNSAWTSERVRKDKKKSRQNRGQKSCDASSPRNLSHIKRSHYANAGPEPRASDRRLKQLVLVSTTFASVIGVDQEVRTYHEIMFPLRVKSVPGAPPVQLSQNSSRIAHLSNWII